MGESVLEKVQENGRVELAVLGGGVQVRMKVRREMVYHRLYPFLLYITSSKTLH